MPSAEETVQGQTTTGQQTTQTTTEGAKPGQQTQQTTQQTSTQRPDAANNSGQDEATRGLTRDLQNERKARQELQKQFTALQGQLTAEQRRIQALVGVTPKSEQDVEIETVKARILELFPQLGKLDDAMLERLMGVAESASGIEEATQHHWTVHSQGMLNDLQGAVAEELGKDLNDRQKRALARAYVAEAEANPEFLARHQQGDPKLIEEFAKAWVEDWFEPVRKQTVTQEVSRRRPVPNGRDRNVQTTPSKAIDFKNPKAVEDAMVESFKSHGGRFDA